VKFKRKLTKAVGTPKRGNEPGYQESDPTSPMLPLGQERGDNSAFNSKSELRQGQSTVDPNQKQYAKSQLNEFAA
jgi:hypothetical protein